MADLSTHSGDLLVTGRLIAGTISLPADAVQDTQVIAAANLAASKLEHQYQKVWAQESTTDAATERRVVHVVKGTTGTLISFKAGAVTVAGAATTVTVDLLKNGTTVLTSVITLDNSQVAYELEDGSAFTSTALVVGDVLEIKLILTGTNEPKGVFAEVVLREKAQ